MLIKEIPDLAIDIYEKRDFVAAEGHSIALALSQRGLHGLKMAGIDASELKTVPLYGRGVHPSTGDWEFQQYGRKGEHLSAVSRSHLHDILIGKIEQHAAIRIFKGC